MSMPTPNPSTLLPQHRPAAVAFYQPYITRYLESGYVLITDFKSLAKTTFSARLRDAMKSTLDHNWQGYDSLTLEELRGSVVAFTEQGIEFRNKMKERANIDVGVTNIKQSTATDTIIEYELTTERAIDLACSLLNFGLVKPQPLFFTTIRIDPHFLAIAYPNVTIIPDPITPNKHRFL